MNDRQKWYEFDGKDLIDSPALLFYPERIKKNINILKEMVGDNNKLRPHIKTSKTEEVVLLMLKAGIKKFKCATIAEAELLGICKAPDVLLAYQPTYPKLLRFIKLCNQYPLTKFSCLADNVETVKMFASVAKLQNVTLNVFIDLNVGMNRTGIKPGASAVKLYKLISKTKGLKIAGFHAYDGHLNDINFTKREIECNRLFSSVEKMREQLNEKGYGFPLLVAGGSPTFLIHAKRRNVECSPGTFVFWDKGYRNNIPEQEFLFAALILCRVISLPAKDKICVDLGYKAIAAENKIDKRVFFLNAPELKPIGHSEEHMVLKSIKNHSYKIGDVLFALPYHICPSVALHNYALIVANNSIDEKWKIVARNRKINI